MIFKVVIVCVLFVIIASLFSALYFLAKDKEASVRIAKALTLRIGLSIGLFVFLLIGYYLNWIPHASA